MADVGLFRDTYMFVHAEHVHIYIYIYKCRHVWVCIGLGFEGSGHLSRF